MKKNKFSTYLLSLNKQVWIIIFSVVLSSFITSLVNEQDTPFNIFCLFEIEYRGILLSSISVAFLVIILGGLVYMVAVSLYFLIDFFFNSRSFKYKKIKYKKLFEQHTNSYIINGNRLSSYAITCDVTNEKNEELSKVLFYINFSLNCYSIVRDDFIQLIPIEMNKQKNEANKSYLNYIGDSNLILSLDAIIVNLNDLLILQKKINEYGLSTMYLNTNIVNINKTTKMLEFFVNSKNEILKILNHNKV